ncbi:hypothetical protein QVD17_07552 [Tagetes erecta]|uniref:Uncharacterized protein n=1 Tax=Tagetes erecta TaxID=13708 RepID=A0AAD8LG29_TARER|nr:hypothetical protein QVD17_02797 [Tagetes erecta]KAK1441554.1 hypothetical protein QVD17_07552 [Tagetes erecta]
MSGTRGKVALPQLKHSSSRDKRKQPHPQFSSIHSGTYTSAGRSITRGGLNTRSTNLRVDSYTKHPLFVSDGSDANYDDELLEDYDEDDYTDDANASPRVSESNFSRYSQRNSSDREGTRKTSQRPPIYRVGAKYIWGTDEWQKKSVAGKRNRASADSSGKRSRHTGGSVGFDEHRIRLKTKLGREPSFGEVFLETHLIKESKIKLWAGELQINNMEGMNFCTARARKAYVSYLYLL